MRNLSINNAPQAWGKKPRRFWTWHQAGDSAYLCRSLIIPLPGDRAFRIGFKFSGWAYFGPRLFKVRAARSFVDDYAHLKNGFEGEVTEADRQAVRESLREMDIEVEGDLRSVPDQDGSE